MFFSELYGINGVFKTSMGNEFSQNKGFKHIPTGIGNVDDILNGGLLPAHVYLLCGDTGVGKSTLAIQIGYNISKYIKSIYLSFILSKLEVASKIGSYFMYTKHNESDITVENFFTKDNLSNEQEEFLNSQIFTILNDVYRFRLLNKYPLNLDDIEEILVLLNGKSEKDNEDEVGYVNEYKDEQYNPSVLFVDCLQLIDSPNCIDSIVKLKQLAYNFEIPVFLISNDSNYSEFEHYVDFILTLKEQNQEGLSKLSLVKNRYGVPVTTTLKPNFKYSYFE